MTLDEWRRIKYFRPTEAWGDPAKMSFNLVQAVDHFRDLTGVKMIVTAGTQGKHVDGSYHYKGEAVDLIFPDGKPQDLLDLAFTAMRIGMIGGIGVYPQWKYQGRIVGGMHLDIRQAALKALWIGHGVAGGGQIYLPFSTENLRKAGVIA